MNTTEPRKTPKTLADYIREARARIRELTADELEEMIDEREDLLLVDVREHDEYQAGHIPKALLVPRGMLEGAADPNNKHRLEALYSARQRPVVVYCETGARSAMAADTLQEMGFEEVYNLAGGTEIWEAEDLPLVRD